MSKTVAVFNANAAQAAPVAIEAARLGLNVRAIVRDTEKTKQLNAVPNIELFVADLLNEKEVIDAMTGVDAAFFHMPVPADPEHPATWLKNFIAAANQTALPLLVFSTSGPAGDAYPSTPMIDGVTAVTQAIQNGVENVITLQPTVYLENLFVAPFVPQLHSEGVLTYPPIPSGFKLSFISHLDQGKIAAAALQRNDLAGQTFKIATPNAASGEDLALALESWVGKPVTFAPETPEAFGDHIGKLFGSDEVGLGLAGLYNSIIGAGEGTIKIDIAAIEQTFDIKLTSIEQHIANWPRP